MFGKVFKIIKEKNFSNVFVSFGGLILKLSGKTDELQAFTDDLKVYLLMRKAWVLSNYTD